MSIRRRSSRYGWQEYRFGSSRPRTRFEPHRRRRPRLPTARQSFARAGPAGDRLLADSITESTTVAKVGDPQLANGRGGLTQLVHVLPKPGVMDPVALSTLQALQDMSLPVEQVTTFRKYWLSNLEEASLNRLCQNCFQMIPSSE